MPISAGGDAPLVQGIGKQKEIGNLRSPIANSSMTSPRTTYIVISLGAMLWCGLLLLAPYLAASSSPLAEFAYRFFHPICHQLPERSFHLFGEKLAVCSRCSSIYFAFLAGTLLYAFLYRSINLLLHNPIHSRIILFLALLPMLTDVGLEFLGIHDSTFLTRAISGALFGCVVPFFVLPAAIEAVQQLSTPKPITINEHQKGISNA